MDFKGLYKQTFDQVRLSPDKIRKIVDKVKNCSNSLKQGIKGK